MTTRAKRSEIQGQPQPQPHAVRATLASGSAQERRMTARAKRSEIQGRQHHFTLLLSANHLASVARSASVICVALFMGMALSTTACW
jgi:hypothetical protein